MFTVNKNISNRLQPGTFQKPLTGFFCTLIYVLFAASVLYAQDSSALRSVNISKTKPSWQAVIGGESVAPAAQTSYGFAVVTDGRMISTCTFRGNVMWQKSIQGRPSSAFTSFGDFLYAVTNDSVLNFINPSGKTLWSVDCGFKVIQSPLCGRDGRVFVYGNKNLACYGLKGSRKWNLEIEDAQLRQINELPDGSLLALTENEENSKTKGIRISPFGQILENITFAGKIVCASNSTDGVLLSFSDGSFGLCTSENSETVSRWVLKNPASSSIIKLIISSKDISAMLYNEGTQLKVLMIKNQTGELLKTFSCGTLNLNDIVSFRATLQGFFVSDSFRAIEFDGDGNIFWEAFLPSRANWNYISYTDFNQLLLCQKDWTLNAYLMNQSVKNKKTLFSQKEIQPYTTPSKKIQKYDGIIYSSISQERIEEIKNAFYSKKFGTEEKQMLEELQELSLCYKEELYDSAKNSREDNSFFSKNPLYTQPFLQAMSESETDIFTGDFAVLLQNETSPLMLQTLIIQAGNSLYDKDGEILKAFENIITKKLMRRDTKTAELICDATYRIVSFMGRPAFYRQGKQIVSVLMSSRFDTETQEYARTTFSKIMSL